MSTGKTPVTEAEQEQYNQHAMEMAYKVDKYRREQMKKRIAKAGGMKNINPRDLFPEYNKFGYGVAMETSRVGENYVSEELQQKADKLGFRFEHLATTIGTVVHGIDLKKKLTTEIVGFLEETLSERKVIFFRNQHLSADEHVAFGKRFGMLDAFPFGRPSENPYALTIVHNEKSPGQENGFHTDVTWMERPSLGSIAQMLEVPPKGGDTLFADSHAAYLGLPLKTQQVLKHVEGINDYRQFIGTVSEELQHEYKKRFPFGVSHPLLRTHPVNGKTALYLNGGFLNHDSLYDIRTGKKLDVEKSEKIVNFLMQQHIHPEYHCRFDWHEGDIAFWDNRACQHCAASDYYPHRRVLRRVTVCGDKPFYDPSQDHMDPNNVAEGSKL